jgi:multiple sugar transport system ATP-binding protein
MATVGLQNVTKSFGKHAILHGISFDIKEGDFVALVGPSGCGKSTLLRLIAGLDDLTGGDILIDNKIVNFAPPKTRDIAMVFQNYALYPHMTVAQNMGFSLRLQKETRAEIKAQVEKAAGILGLEPLLDRYPRQLSGGQRQRVAMGRAIVRNPKVFLFDEPLSNLDAKLRVQMRADIKELHQRLKTTTIYVTHDQIEALTMADQIVVLNAGRIEQIGPPLQLYDYPDTMFVAGFIGSPSMNFIRGTVRTGRVSSFLAENGARFPLAANDGMYDGQAAVYGFRPEHIALRKGGLKAEVVVAEPTGSETLVVARLGGEPMTLLFRQRVNVRSGAIIEIAIDPSRIHLFDYDSGKRLKTQADVAFRQEA